MEKKRREKMVKIHSRRSHYSDILSDIIEVYSVDISCVYRCSYRIPCLSDNLFFAGWLSPSASYHRDSNYQVCAKVNPVLYNPFHFDVSVVDIFFDDWNRAIASGFSSPCSSIPVPSSSSNYSRLPLVQRDCIWYSKLKFQHSHWDSSVSDEYWINEGNLESAVCLKYIDCQDFIPNFIDCEDDDDIPF
jgi:hypothetical protein